MILLDLSGRHLAVSARPTSIGAELIVEYGLRRDVTVANGAVGADQGRVVLITLTAEDVRDVEAILRFASSSERKLACVCAVLHDGGVRWFTTDNQCLAFLERGSADTLAGQIAIPKRDFLVAAELARTRQSPHLNIEMHRQGVGQLRLPGITIFFDSRPERVLEIAEAAEKLGHPEHQLLVSRSDLAAVVRAASVRPYWLPADARKRFFLRADRVRGVLEARAEWTGSPDTVAAVGCQASADVVIALEPTSLLDAAAAADTPDITIVSGSAGKSPVWITSANGPSVLLMPHQPFGYMRSRFEQVLAEILDLDPENLHPDEDGDYPLDLRSGDRAYIRLEAGDEVQRVPSRIRIWMVIARDIEMTMEALEEINLENQRRRFARIYIVDGVVAIESDIALEDVTRPQLQNAIETFADVATQVSPLMRAFFGKSAPRTPEEND